MTKIVKINLIQNYFDELLPNAGCELFYNHDYELAIAVMLSAQTTDKAVNGVTVKLFKDYPSLSSLNNVPLSTIENYLKPLGLYKNKAQHLKGIVAELLKAFNGKLPSDKKLLTTLPGIGNKSAGVIRAEVFKIPDLPVDTHIIRLSNRLGLVNNEKDPYKIEQVLKKIFPKERWILLHHQFIHFGRYYCTARNPKCQECKLQSFCKH